MVSDRLLIFDIDGTLLQTDTVTVPAVQQAFRDYGLPEPDKEAICFFFGKPVEDYEAWMASLCTEGKAEEVVAHANALELQCMRTCGLLYPKALETVETLHDRGYRMAICSNGPEPYVAAFVEAHGMAPFFSTVYARGTRYRDKTEMTGLILEQHRPAAFAVIGDRHDDIEAALAHGGIGIAAAYGFGSAPEYEQAERVLASIAELPECLNTLWYC